MLSQVGVVLMGLLAVGHLLGAARDTHAQVPRSVVDDVAAGSVRHVGRDATQARHVDLTLDDAVQRALQRNLDIAVQRICQRSPKSEGPWTGRRPQHVGGVWVGIVGKSQSGRACAEPASRPSAPRSGGGAKRRALTPVSTRSRCRLDDAGGHHNILWSTGVQFRSGPRERQHIAPLVQDMAVATASAAFLPFASSGFGLNQATVPNRSLFDGGGLRGQPIVNDRGSYNLGIGQQVKWGGGRYDVTWDSTRWESTNIFSTFNPSFGANMTLQYTQPLLRGFRTDARRTELVVSRINRDISDIDLEETVINTLANVSLAYWDLVYARAAVGVQLHALELAEQLVADNRARVEVGTMAPIDVVQARSEAAARRQLLAQAVETQRTTQTGVEGACRRGNVG